MKKTATMTILAIVAAITALGVVVSSSGFVVSALAQRGGGQSNNGCGLTAESTSQVSDENVLPCA